MYWRKYGRESKKKNEKELGKEEGMEDSKLGGLGERKEGGME